MKVNDRDLKRIRGDIEHCRAVAITARVKPGVYWFGDTNTMISEVREGMHEYLFADVYNPQVWTWRGTVAGFTAYGDGFYMDAVTGQEVSVDSGTLGLMPDSNCYDFDHIRIEVPDGTESIMTISDYRFMLTIDGVVKLDVDTDEEDEDEDEEAD